MLVTPLRSGECAPERSRPADDNEADAGTQETISDELAAVVDHRIATGESALLAAARAYERTAHDESDTTERLQRNACRE
jgi:hypothetical protein